MFRRYLCHLQCYIFFKFVTLRWQYCVLTSLAELVTLSYLQGESQDYVFHLLVEVGFLLFYEHRFLTLYLSLNWYLVAAESRIWKQSGVQDVRQDSEFCRCLKTFEDLSESKCPRTRVEKRRLVSPT